MGNCQPANSQRKQADQKAFMNIFQGQNNLSLTIVKNMSSFKMSLIVDDSQ